MGYRIPKRGPKEYTIKVRLHPSDAHMVVSYFEGDDIPTILRAHARKHAPRMMRTLPLLLRTIVRKRDGHAIEYGGPGMALALMAEQLYQSCREC